MTACMLGPPYEICVQPPLVEITWKWDGSMEIASVWKFLIWKWHGMVMEHIYYPIGP